jgi:hypothetical protein
MCVVDEPLKSVNRILAKGDLRYKSRSATSRGIAAEHGLDIPFSWQAMLKAQSGSAPGSYGCRPLLRLVAG